MGYPGPIQKWEMGYPKPIQKWEMGYPGPIQKWEMGYPGPIQLFMVKIFTRVLFPKPVIETNLIAVSWGLTTFFVSKSEQYFIIKGLLVSHVIRGSSHLPISFNNAMRRF